MGIDYEDCLFLSKEDPDEYPILWRRQYVYYDFSYPVYYKKSKFYFKRIFKRILDDHKILARKELIDW